MSPADLHLKVRGVALWIKTLRGEAPAVVDSAYETLLRAADSLVMPPQSIETLGEVIDDMENVIGALKLPMPPDVHVEQCKAILPRFVKRLREVYKDAAGDDPWDES